MQEVIRQKRRDVMKVIKLIIMVILSVIVWAVVTLAAMMLFGKFIDGWSLKDTPTATSQTKVVAVGATQ